MPRPQDYVEGYGEQAANAAYDGPYLAGHDFDPAVTFNGGVGNVRTLSNNEETFNLKGQRVKADND